MKIFLSAISLMLFAFILLYLAGSIISASFNMWAWEKGIRVMVGFLWFAICVLSTVAAIDAYTKENQ